MTEMMKQKKKKGDDVWASYNKILSDTPSPLEGATKNLVFIWMYFFVQENIDRGEFTKRMLSVEVPALDVCYFVEELEKKREVLKKNVLPIQYVTE